MELERSFEQWSVGSPRIKWGAVFAGWVVGLALQMVLMLLGLGFGAWAIDFRENNPAEGLPTGAAIWTGVSMLIAAFTGGYVTSRLSGISTRRDGLYHGIVVWGVNWLIFAWLTTTAMAAMIGGVFSTFGSTLQAVGQGVSGVASTAANKLGDKLEQISWSPQELRKQIESIRCGFRQAGVAARSSPAGCRPSGRGGAALGHQSIRWARLRSVNYRPSSLHWTKKRP